MPEEEIMLHPKDGPFGFFPMKLGQVLDGRYQIVRKLGYGANASVWLATDTERTNLEHRYVAIKILSVNASNCELAHKCHEIEVSRSMLNLTESESRDPGYSHCAIAQRVFSEDSLYGSHSCVVFPPFGTTLGDLRLQCRDGRFTLLVVKRVTKQVLLALRFLHSRLRIVHGDVKLANVLVKLHARTDAVERFLTGSPAETYPAEEGAGVPPNPIVTVRSQPLPNFGLHPSLENLEVCLTDYGSAPPINSITTDTWTATPVYLQAPEQIFGLVWSQGADIWALGCEVIMMLTGRRPFTPSALFYSSQQHVGSIYDLLGPFPNSFVRRCTYGHMFFDKDGHFTRATPSQAAGDSIETMLGCLSSEVTPQDVEDTCRFIRRCLMIDPLERPTTSELLNDPWLT